MQEHAQQTRRLDKKYIFVPHLQRTTFNQDFWGRLKMWCNDNQCIQQQPRAETATTTKNTHAHEDVGCQNWTLKGQNSWVHNVLVAVSGWLDEWLNEQHLYNIYFLVSNDMYSAPTRKIKTFAISEALTLHTAFTTWKHRQNRKKRKKKQQGWAFGSNNKFFMWNMHPSHPRQAMVAHVVFNLVWSVLQRAKNCTLGHAPMGQAADK